MDARNYYIIRTCVSPRNVVGKLVDKNNQGLKVSVSRRWCYSNVKLW